MFVKILLLLVGGLFVLSSIGMGKPIYAIFSFLFFFTYWAILQFVDRDKTVVSTKDKLQFRFILLIGALVMLAALFFFISSLISAQYKNAVGNLSVFILLGGNAWRFRKELKLWLSVKGSLKNNENS